MLDPAPADDASVDVASEASLLCALHERAEDIFLHHFLPLFDLCDLLCLARTATGMMLSALAHVRRIGGANAWWQSTWPRRLVVHKGRPDVWQRALVLPTWLSAGDSNLSRCLAEEVHVDMVPACVVSRHGMQPTWRIECEWQACLRHPTVTAAVPTHALARLIVHVDGTDPTFGISHRERVPRTNRVLGHAFEIFGDEEMPNHLLGLSNLFWARLIARESSMAMVKTRSDGALYVTVVPRGSGTLATKTYAEVLEDVPRTVWPGVRIVPDVQLRSTLWIHSRLLRQGSACGEQRGPARISLVAVRRVTH